MDNEEYLTITETCKLLRIDKSTLYWWRKRGMIHVHKIGNKFGPVRIAKSEIERLMRESVR